MATSDLSSTPTMASTSATAPIVFSHNLSVKLDFNNFLLWRPQVHAAIIGHQLEDYIDPDFAPPPRFLSDIDRQTRNVNKAFILWHTQDQLLYSWLLSSMTESILIRVVSCRTSAAVWKILDEYYTAQTTAKVDQFENQLRNVKKGSMSINDYLLKIKVLVDKLESVGRSITVKEHIAAIFNGLPSHCLISGDDKKKERKKKIVKFAENVKEPRGNGEEFRNRQKKRSRMEMNCRNEIPGIQTTPSNHLVLYNGIIKDRVQRLECSY